MSLDTFYTGDIVRVKDVKALRSSLREHPDLLAAVIDVADLQQVAMQIGTIIVVRFGQKALCDVALVALNNGTTINLPTSAVEVLDPNDLVDEGYLGSPSDVLRMRPLMRRDDSFMNHDLSGEEMLVHNMAASSIQLALR